MRSFYEKIAEELSTITERPKTELLSGLFNGYLQLKAIRRSRGFKDSSIVPTTLVAISKILNVSPESVRRSVIRTILKISPQECVIEDVKEILMFVESSNLKAVTVGNVLFWPGSYNRMILERAGLTKFFEAQYYADEVGISKPKSEIFTKVLSQYELKPEEALHVGDGLFDDFAGAILSSMFAVLIDKRIDKMITLSDGRGYIIPNLKELITILKMLR